MFLLFLCYILFINLPFPINLISKSFLHFFVTTHLRSASLTALFCSFIFYLSIISSHLHHPVFPTISLFPHISLSSFSHIIFSFFTSFFASFVLLLPTFLTIFSSFTSSYLHPFLPNGDNSLPSARPMTSSSAACSRFAQQFERWLPWIRPLQTGNGRRQSQLQTPPPLGRQRLPYWFPLPLKPRLPPGRSGTLLVRAWFTSSALFCSSWPIVGPS